MSGADAVAETEGEWLATGQAGHRLGLGPQRIRQLADQGRLEVKPTALGRLISAKSVDALLRERRGKRGGRGG